MKDMAMNQPVNPIIPPEQSLIEYPCAFPIKVMGPHLEDFVESVVALIVQHDPALRPIQALERRPSSTGKYVGLTVTVNGHQPRASGQHLPRLDRSSAGEVRALTG
jgi:putative lipoic acid-binding regulatory protein